MPNKCRLVLHGYKVGYSTVRTGLKLCIMFGLLLVVCGDVEVNPGPATDRGSVQRPQGRQTQLSFSQPTALPSSEPRTRHQRQQQNRIPEPQTPPSNSADILYYLREMRTEVRTEFSSINNKIDDINLRVNQLKAEHESLKDENKRLWTEIDVLTRKTDTLET